MIAWIKFYLGGFFYNEWALQGKGRSVWNSILAFFTGWILILVGLVVGYSTSFEYHLHNCDSITAVIQKLYNGDVSITIENNVAISVIDGYAENSVVINTFTNSQNAEDYKVGEYNFILDTRPINSTYDDFTVDCNSINGGEEISYSEYKLLDKDLQSKYKVSTVYTGNTVQFDADNILKYRTYLETVANESDKNYNSEIAAQYKDLSESDINGLYELYVKAYYPEIYGNDSYGKVPTIRTWYVNNILDNKERGNFLAIFDDTVIGEFVTDNGIPVSFTGYYMKMNGYTAMTAEQGSEFVVKSFNGASAVNINIYFFNLLRITPLLFLIPLILGLLIWLIDKPVKSGEFTRFGQTLKVICPFVFYSSLLTFLFAIVASFLLPRGAVYSLSVLVYAIVLIIRTIVVAIPRYIGANKFKVKNITES